MTLSAGLSRYIPPSVRRSLRAGLTELTWLTRRLPDDPAVELYSRRQNAVNERFFRQVTAERAQGEEAWMAPYRAQDIPRTVWMFWAQGEADLPPVVATCLARWRLLNPGWDVRVLDRATADGLVDMRDVPKSFPLRIYADSLRLRLLERFGGVWADATVYPHRPLADWLGFLAASGFFLFTDDGPGREVSSWFIAARPGHPLATAWNRAFSRHLSRTDGPHEAYFHLYYVMQYALKHDFALKAHWAVMPRVPAPPCFFLRSCLEGLTPASAARDAIRSGLPISKMDWRLPETGEDLDTRIARILALD